MTHPARGSGDDNPVVLADDDATARPALDLGVRDMLLIALAWTVVGLFNADQTYVTLAVAGRTVPWLRVVGYAAPGMVLWALLTAPVMWLTIRFPRKRGGIAVHLAGMLVACLADTALYHVLDPHISPYGNRTFFAGFVRYLGINCANYLGIVAFTLITRYERMLQERRIAAAELASQLTTAHLRSLQAQLRPHFLFNTLNTVAELVHRDPDAAERLIARLGSLLRRSFDRLVDQEVSLATELEFLRDYSEIVCARFQGRITITTLVDADTLGARVPSLILQPLVENAVRHGLEPRAEGGSIEVVAYRRVDVLELEVRDDGCGLPRENATGDAAWREGVGLRNTADRLAHLYGDAHRFSVRPRVTGGTIVALQIPYSTTAGDPAALAGEPVHSALALVP